MSTKMFGIWKRSTSAPPALPPKNLLSIGDEKTHERLRYDCTHKVVFVRGLLDVLANAPSLSIDAPPH